MAELFFPLGWNFSPGCGQTIARRNTKQAQTTQPLEAQAPKIWFWLRNHEHWAELFLLTEPGFAQSLCSNIFLSPQEQGTWISLLLRDEESPDHFIHIPVYHRLLNATLEPTQLLSGLSLLSNSQLKAPRDTECCSPWVCSSRLSPSLLKICSLCLICICLASSLSHWLLFGFLW